MSKGTGRCSIDKIYGYFGQAEINVYVKAKNTIMKTEIGQTVCLIIVRDG